MRLTFFILPVTVAENRFGVWRSWELTKGNFWRIVGVAILIFIPLLIIEWIVVGIMFGPFVVQMASAAQSGGPAAIQAAVSGMMQSMIRNLPYIAAAALLLTPLLYGLLISPPAFAYRALVPSAGSAADVFGDAPT